MDGMPLILSSTQALLGPLVPALGRLKKVRTEGLAPGERVSIFGLNAGDKTLLLDVKDGDIEWNLDVSGWSYIQAEKTPTRNPVHVWLENP